MYLTMGGYFQEKKISKFNKFLLQHCKRKHIEVATVSENTPMADWGRAPEHNADTVTVRRHTNTVQMQRCTHRNLLRVSALTFSP